MENLKGFSDAPRPVEYLRAALRSHVYEIVKVTPLQIMKNISERLSNIILVKREDRQLVHSFKLRGAYAMISSLNSFQKSSGVITASAGNHAQGVALSARELGISSLIVMPKNTADIKVNAVRRFGAQLILTGDNFDEAQVQAVRLAKERNLTFIPPFDHPIVISGQATLAMELLQQDANLDRVFVPVGGGGLAAGVSVLIKHLMPNIRVIGVEAEESASLCAALSAGRPVHLKKMGLFAEGVAVRCVGNETFRLCQEFLDDVITVDSDAICSAVKDLFEDVRAVAEPSGALALAGMKKYVQVYNIKGERLAHILSGANVNFHELRYLSERCELGEQREVLMAVIIPEKRGSFLEFCKLLGNRLVTEFSYRYNGSDKVCVFVSVRLMRGNCEKEEIFKEIKFFGYDVVDLSDDEMAKLHVRYMIGGKLSNHFHERIFSFDFPEFSGALLNFLHVFGTRWNISLFHYRSYGTNYGRVLAGFELRSKEPEFEYYLSKLGYNYHDVTTSLSYRFFLLD